MSLPCLTRLSDKQPRCLGRRLTALMMRLKPRLQLTAATSRMGSSCGGRGPACPPSWGQETFGSRSEPAEGFLRSEPSWVTAPSSPSHAKSRACLQTLTKTTVIIMFCFRISAYNINSGRCRRKCKVAGLSGEGPGQCPGNLKRVSL